ncbi:peptidase S16 lon domain protein [Thermobaculum terrenum ATCC BAA-798]|uniref:Peptidase S16 lon domain protein n=1 Tax=Thermobaculum terrenum (strain ATCC BAA-798 / CCMEE 7001 / YNP1) TaxID=525904 RepID=D1CC05_THET1|nr:peptidase S16 lon domain protein [Thermobaculum terrenum ATCC BAA-798]
MQPSVNIIPLFPLHTVLFPGMLLPLHIFEERYKIMISRCLAHDGMFGVVKIRKGKEVGGPAEPEEIGTMARIVSAGKYPDGRMDLLTVGKERFRILRLIDDEPYLQAEIEFLRDEEEDEHEVSILAEEVRDLISDYRKKAGIKGSSDEISHDIQSLSFVAGALHIPLSEKQKILECTSARQRLDWVAKHLRAEISLLDKIGPTRPIIEPDGDI